MCDMVKAQRLLVRKDSFSRTNIIIRALIMHEAIKTNRLFHGVRIISLDKDGMAKGGSKQFLTNNRMNY